MLRITSLARYDGSMQSSLKQNLLKVSVGALGVVYGDIGTSPLYAMKESLAPEHGVPLLADNVLGVLSLVFWSLSFVISFYYLFFVLRADNHGEGGIAALLALLQENLQSKAAYVVFPFAIFGAALLYGEGILTPAISVLSAVEGLSLITPTFSRFVIPITIGIITLLFGVQKFGTAKIGAIFGPLTALWFLAISASGIPWIIENPSVVRALNPWYAVQFFLNNGLSALWVMGSVFLCITGAAALYADMGHFGRRPIIASWFSLVFPALLINYFGQGAFLLTVGERGLGNPFYEMVPTWGLYPMIAIATIATVIASQALISGAFSLTQQVVQLGYLPRITIVHTSASTEGQIYVPLVNWLLYAGVIVLVLNFRESSALAAAYGIGVISVMLITTILLFFTTQSVWKWSLLKAAPLFVLFLSVDLTYFFANLVKFPHGGWIPITIGVFLYFVMRTWKKGRELLSRSMINLAVPMETFFKKLELVRPPRVKGTAVFMSLNRDIAPTVLLHHFEHNKALHEQVILLSIITEARPDVPTDQRVRITDMDHGFHKVVARYGYMQSPNVEDILVICETMGLKVDLKKVSYYLGRETLLTTGRAPWTRWRKSIFAFLSRNSRPATAFFGIPPDQVIEVGTQIEV